MFSFLLWLVAMAQIMESLLDLPRSTFKQSNDEIDAIVWLTLRFVTFLDCAVGAAHVVALVTQILAARPDWWVFPSSTLVVAMCLFHAFRLRFWQYPHDIAWYRWFMCDWVVLLVGALVAAYTGQPGYGFVVGLNALARVVHMAYFRKAVVVRGEKERRIFMGASWESGVIADEDASVRARRYNRLVREEEERLRQRGQQDFPLGVPPGDNQPLPEDQDKLVHRLGEADDV